MAYYKGTLGLIGNTPLVEVTNIEKELGLEATVLVKLEYFNPAGSVKDRIAKAMIEDAEQKGILKEGAVIIEPTPPCVIITSALSTNFANSSCGTSSSIFILGELNFVYPLCTTTSSFIFPLSIFF